MPFFYFDCAKKYMLRGQILGANAQLLRCSRGVVTQGPMNDPEGIFSKGTIYVNPKTVDDLSSKVVEKVSKQ